MKTILEKRNLSQIFFKYKDENYTFEDLPIKEQFKILNENNQDYIKNIANTLLNKIEYIIKNFSIVLDNYIINFIFYKNKTKKSFKKMTIQLAKILRNIGNDNDLYIE